MQGFTYVRGLRVGIYIISVRTCRELKPTFRSPYPHLPLLFSLISLSPFYVYISASASLRTCVPSLTSISPSVTSLSHRCISTPWQSRATLWLHRYTCCLHHCIATSLYTPLQLCLHRCVAFISTSLQLRLIYRTRRKMTPTPSGDVPEPMCPKQGKGGGRGACNDNEWGLWENLVEINPWTLELGVCTPPPPIIESKSNSLENRPIHRGGGVTRRRYIALAVLHVSYLGASLHRLQTIYLYIGYTSPTSSLPSPVFHLSTSLDYVSVHI